MFMSMHVLIFLFVKTGERLQALHEEEQEEGKAWYGGWTYKVARDLVHISTRFLFVFSFRF